MEQPYVIRRSNDTYGFFIVRQDAPNKTVDRVFVMESESPDRYNVLRIDFGGMFPRTETINILQSEDSAQRLAREYIGRSAQKLALMRETTVTDETDQNILSFR